MTKTVNRIYRAHATLSRLHHSTAFHRAVRGPRGSGKSTGCCTDIFGKARQQEKSPDGFRHTRFAVVRNTYRELMDTTLKTWMYWFQKVPGQFNQQQMTHFIHYGNMRCEVLFRALDRPGDIKKTLSMELTGAYINEAKEIPFGIISGLDDAIGRYPARDIPNGFMGPSWSGMILDTNSPDDDHWWYKLETAFQRGELDPDVWAFFVQPGGLIEKNNTFLPNPEAENIENIGENYYTTRMVGKSKDHIRVYYCNQFGFVQDGKAIHPEYVDATHCAKEMLVPISGLPIFVGIDFGLTPAATFGQRLVNGRWHILAELVTEHMGIKNFSEELKRFIKVEFPGFVFRFWGDPAGSQESQTDEKTPFQILIAAGFDVVPAHRNNDPIIRREALQAPLERMVDGKPGMLVSPRCKVLRKGLAGGYCYRRKQIAGTEQYHEKPDKNRYSHVCEAAEYMCLGAGEGKLLIEKPPSDNVDMDDFELRYDIDMDTGDYQSGGWMR